MSNFIKQTSVRHVFNTSRSNAALFGMVGWSVLKTLDYISLDDFFQKQILLGWPCLAAATAVESPILHSLHITMVNQLQPKSLNQKWLNLLYNDNFSMIDNLFIQWLNYQAYKGNIVGSNPKLTTDFQSVKHTKECALIEAGYQPTYHYDITSDRSSANQSNTLY